MRITLASQVAIEARLLYAPGEGRVARIKAAGGIRISGNIGPADREMCLPMVPEGVVAETVAAGSPVHVTLVDGTEQIAFYTTIRDISAEGHLLLRFPAAVQIQEHRDDFREPLDLDECVRIEVSDGERSLVFPVIDVSRAGLSFRYGAGVLLLTQGASFTARLTAPGLVPYTADIEVRNVRSDPDQRGAKVAGVKVVRPPPDLLAWLRCAEAQLMAA